MDSATYDALARLAQPWVHSYLLLDFHGNVGSQFGDSQASMRYTEAKLSKLAEDGYLATIDKGTVDWGMNYTNDEKEPESLPAVFPGLFCLSNQGVGYGCACFFLSFNLGEVSEQIINRLYNRPVETIQFDLPTGGTITNPQDMPKIMKSGKGTVVVEATYSIDNNEIDFTELPYGVMFDDVVEQIKGLSDKGELQGITGVINDSGRDGIKLKIRLNKNASAQDVLDFLLSKTSLRSKYAINQVALVDSWPQLLSFSDMADQYIKHNLSCIVREAEHDKSAAEARAHVLEGLSSAIASIDDVVAIIRNSSDRKSAAEALASKYGWSEEQVKAILDMRLSKLASLEAVEIKKELDEKVALAIKFKKILDSEIEQKKILASRLRALAKKYGKPRKTKIEQKELKHMSGDVSLQRYSLKFENGLLYKKKDDNGRPESDMLICVSSRGNVYRICVSDVPETKESGYNLSLLLGERIDAVDPVNMVFVTSDGKVKRINIPAEFSGNTRNKAGMKAVKLAEFAHVIYCGEYTSEDVYLQLTTVYANKIKFPLSEVPVQKKSGSGVKAITLVQGDDVIDASLTDDPSGVQKRGGKGKRA